MERKQQDLEQREAELMREREPDPWVLVEVDNELKKFTSEEKEKMTDL